MTIEMHPQTNEEDLRLQRLGLAKNLPEAPVAPEAEYAYDVPVSEEEIALIKDNDERLEGTLDLAVSKAVYAHERVLEQQGIALEHHEADVEIADSEFTRRTELLDSNRRAAYAAIDRQYERGIQEAATRRSAQLDQFDQTKEKAEKMVDVSEVISTDIISAAEVARHGLERHVRRRDGAIEKLNGFIDSYVEKRAEFEAAKNEYDTYVQKLIKIESDILVVEEAHVEIQGDLKAARELAGDIAASQYEQEHGIKLSEEAWVTYAKQQGAKASTAEIGNVLKALQVSASNHIRLYDDRDHNVAMRNTNENLMFTLSEDLATLQHEISHERALLAGEIAEWMQPLNLRGEYVAADARAYETWTSGNAALLEAHELTPKMRPLVEAISEYRSDLTSGPEAESIPEIQPPAFVVAEPPIPFLQTPEQQVSMEEESSMVEDARNYLKIVENFKMPEAPEEPKIVHDIRKRAFKAFGVAVSYLKRTNEEDKE